MTTARTMIALALCLTPSLAAAGTITRTATTTAEFDYRWNLGDGPPVELPPLATFDFRDAPLSDLDSINRIDVALIGGAYIDYITDGKGWGIELDGTSAPLGDGVYQFGPGGWAASGSYATSLFEPIRQNLLSDGLLVMRMVPEAFTRGIFAAIGPATLSISGPNIVPEPNSWVLLAVGMMLCCAMGFKR